MQKICLGLFLLALAACAHTPDQADDSRPLDVRLQDLVTFYNARQFEQVRTLFTKSATVQSPVTPRRASVDAFLAASAAENGTIGFHSTEVLFSQPGWAKTRSMIVANSPGRYSYNEPVEIDWRLEDGYWRISRLTFSNWSSILGVWHRGGMRGETSIELRILPGGIYQVYFGQDQTVPAFKGTYRLEGNKITFADESASEASMFQKGEGSYMFTFVPKGMEFRLVEDENTWRSERYPGLWFTAK